MLLVNLNWYRNELESIKDKQQEIIHAFDNPDKGIFLKVININLDKYANMSYNEIKKSDEFYKLLTIDNYEELIKFTKGNRLLDKYVCDLIKFSKKVDEEDDDNMDMGIELHFRDESIYDMGMEKGIKQNQRDIVLNMFENNLPLETIKKCTKLSISKIKEIIKDNNNK